MATANIQQTILRAEGIPQNKEIRFRANVGGTIDIPTGRWHHGEYGESIMNGGVTLYEGVSGKANNFKTTIVADFVAIILERYTNMQSSCTWSDQEETSDMGRIASIIVQKKGFDVFADDPMAIYDLGYITVTDKGSMPSNKWWEGIRNFVDAKVKNKSLMMDSEFADRHGKPISFLLPSVSVIDSISELEGEDVMAIRDKTEIGQKEANMLYMHQGRGKDRLIREAQTVASRGNHFMLMTAQWGEDKADIGASPMSGPKAKKMNTIRQGEKIRGVPDSFLYLPQHVWLINGSENLKDDSRSNAEFPLDFDSSVENLDLWRCPTSMIRSKTGLSAFSLDLIVSQKRGFQPTLTEFFNIFRRKKRYGIDGAGQHYSLDLYPELKLQRTEIRTKIDTDPLLRRAINITSEISQIGDYDVHWSSRIPTMKDLRKKLEADGYDWNILLQTRGWFTFKEFKPFCDPFLSSMDILKMYYNEYTPYWLEADKKTIKKEFRKVPKP